MRSSSLRVRQARSPGRRASAAGWAWLAATGLALGFFVAPRVARACSCAAPPPTEQALKDADAVFEASAYSLSADQRWARYGFDVDRVWKGSVGPRVEIVTSRHSASCGRSFEVGTRYVIYARKSNNGEWGDHMCSRTRTSRSAVEDLRILGAGHDPVDASTPLVVPDSGGSGPTEPPRIQAPPPEPPPTTPTKRGCAVEKPHTMEGLYGLGLLGILVAIGRRRAVGSLAAAPDRHTGGSPGPRCTFEESPDVDRTVPRPYPRQ